MLKVRLAGYLVQTNKSIYSRCAPPRCTGKTLKAGTPYARLKMVKGRISMIRREDD
jgi:hypothetical protein